MIRNPRYHRPLRPIRRPQAGLFHWKPTWRPRLPLWIQAIALLFTSGWPAMRHCCTIWILCQLGFFMYCHTAHPKYYAVNCIAALVQAGFLAQRLKSENSLINGGVHPGMQIWLIQLAIFLGLAFAHDIGEFLLLLLTAGLDEMHHLLGGAPVAGNANPYHRPPEAHP